MVVIWHCALGCTEPIEVDDLTAVTEHVRLLHPDEYEGIELWPDGAIVVHDVALEAEDFR